jgi:hypothetical protein
MSKLTRFLIIALIVGVIVIITPLLITFTPQLSANVNHWSAFGSYVGGLLSPYIAALALIGLISTIQQQAKQISKLEKQNQCNQLESMIHKIETDFKTDLSSTILNLEVSGKKVEGYTCLDPLCIVAFPNWDKVIPSFDVLEEDIEYSLHSQEIKLFELFGSAAGNLNQLRLYVDKHEKLSGSNVLSKYYKRKYKVPFQRLYDKGFLKHTW